MSEIREVRDSDIYREILDPAEDAQDQQPGPDEDSLRAAFLAGAHHRRAGAPTLRRCLLVIAGSITWAALILLIVWVVTG